MRVIVPTPRESFTDLTHSGAAPSPYPLWAAGTTYALGDRVRKGESEFEAIGPTTGDDPELLEKWIYVGATNPYKVFDKRLYDQAVGVDKDTSVAYEMTSPSSLTAVAFFNLSSARAVEVEVIDGYTDEVLQTVELELVDDAQVLNWADFFFEPPTIRTEAVIDGLQAYAGNVLRIAVRPNGIDPARIGQIVIGRAQRLGEVCEGTVVSIQDYSRKERDEWGNAVIVERPFAQRVEYDIAAPTREVRAIQRILSSVRATPAVYYDGDIDFDKYGTTVYGYYQDFGVNLQVGDVSRMSLEVEGLV